MARSSVGGARTASQPFSSARFSSSKSAAPPPPSRRKSKGKGKAKVDAEAAPTKLARRRAKDDIVGNDVYTFEEGPSKRLRTDDDRFKLSREENALAGGSRRDDEVDHEDSDDDMAARIRQAALKIAGHEALDLGDDESEIDSDAAWDEEGSDDERWGGAFEKWKKNGQSKKAVKAKQQKAKETVETPLNIDLDESDDDMAKTAGAFRPNVAAFVGDNDEDEDDDEDDLELELEDDENMEDEDDEDDEDEQPPASRFKKAVAKGDDNQEEQEDEETASEEDEDEDEEDEDMPEPSLPSESDSEADNDDDADLLDFVQSLPSVGKRKVDDEDAKEEAQSKRRRVLSSQRGPGGRDDAGEFGTTSANKVSLADILATRPSLKQSASALLKPPTTSTSTLRQGTLNAPLPTVVTERLAREAAYEATKAEGDKWGGVMKRIKEAEHLSFPLQGAKGGKERQRGGVKSAGDLVGSFKPTNDMESAVTALLNSANLNSTQVAQAEDDALMGQDLSMEEIAARRADLRHQRELLFRAEARSKRVSKIKSKTFRKLARKRDEKNQVDLEDLQRLDPQKAEEEAMKLEALRAKERATLKHSAKSGRWARDQHGAGETQDKRLEMEEMLRQKERLTRKIRGHGSDDDDNETSDEDEDPIESAYDQLADLRRKEAELSEEAATKTKGIMGMKFMQRAMARDQAKVDAEAAELQKQLEDYEAGRDASEEDDEDEDEAGNVLRIKNNPGRLAFGGVPAGSAAAPGAFTAAPVQDAATESSHTLGSPREEYHSTISKPQLQAEATNEDDEDVNPWLTGAKQTGRARKNNVVIAGKDISAVDRSVAKQKKVKAQNAKHVAVEDAEVDIDLDPKSLLAGKKSMPLEDGDADSDEEELNKKGPKAFKQRDLVAQAFAGDNVIEDFAAEKQKAIEADAPKTEDMTLPGWGSWAGKGVRSRKPPKQFLKTTPGLEAHQRKDFNRSNVIISEKKDKKASKYLATDLPYPYTSAAQYEASFAAPVGSDWNTRATHQRATMPKVIKKPGAIIAPVSRLF